MVIKMKQIVLMLASAVISQSVCGQSSLSTCTIIFSNNFARDTVSMKIDGIDILPKRVVTTQHTYGFTDAWAELRYQKGKTLVKTSDDICTSFLQKDTNFLTLSIVINGSNKVFKVYRMNGSYVYINKCVDILCLTQRKRRLLID